MWSIPFDGAGLLEGGQQPPYAGAMLNGTQLVAYCTMSNVQYYTLASRKPKEPVYAMVVLNSSYNINNEIRFMASKVQQLKVEELVAARHLCRKLWMLSRRFGGEDLNLSQASSSEAPATPFQIRKARRLTLSPTDESIGESPMDTSQADVVPPSVL